MKSFSRRTFLKSTALGGASLATSRVLGANNDIRVRRATRRGVSLDARLSSDSSLRRRSETACKEARSVR
ncbi:MAG: twin-arginine translocation signal domain-containing protein [Planctomycetota bacterium]